MKRLSCTSVILFFCIMFVMPAFIGMCFYQKQDLPGKMFLSKTQDVDITYLDTESGKPQKCGLEEYLVGVLAAEMPAEYELETLKAQAVAARSYILSRLDTVNSDHPEAAICNNPDHCKAHMTEDAAKERWNAEKRELYWDKLKDAVAATRGEYMVCEEEIVEAFFFARSGGRTENSEDVWSESRAYLKSVESEGDLLHPELLSYVEVENREARIALQEIEQGFEGGTAALELGKVVRTEGGNVASIEIDGHIFKGTDIRKVFDLKSADFEVLAGPNSVKFSVKGYGHGVGMSQYGANHMAKNGKNYTEILSHYYTNIQIMKQ